MGNIVTVEADAILTSSVTGASYTHGVLPINLALITDDTTATATTPGTEVTGGSYERMDTTTGDFWGTASGGTITNSAGEISFTGMPATVVAGIELWDSTPTTPIRRWFGTLTENVTKTVNEGDTVTFATSSISIQIS